MVTLLSQILVFAKRVSKKRLLVFVVLSSIWLLRLLIGNIILIHYLLLRFIMFLCLGVVMISLLIGGVMGC